MSDDGYQTLRTVVMVAYQESRGALAVFPVVHDVPMQGWDGALQLQIVRHV